MHFSNTQPITKESSHMAVPKESFTQHVAEGASAATAVVTTHAAKITFFSGLGTIAGAMSKTETAVAVGIIVSLAGLWFGWRRDRREQREHRLRMLDLESRVHHETPGAAQ